jgi:hypothetical protein
MTSLERRTTRAIDELRDQIAPQAQDSELAYLAQVSKRLGLDPIAGHIVLIPRWDKRLNRMVNRPQITADGRLVLADRSGHLDGFTGPEWTGPRKDDGTHTWVDVWDDEYPPHAARVFVYRRGRAHPVNGTVRWTEFAQLDSKGNVMPMWKQMPSHMLGKVALSLGIRRAFPGIVPGGVDDDLTSLEGHEVPDEPTVIPESIPAVTTAEPESPPGVEALGSVLNTMTPASKAAFKDWRRSKGWAWPPADADQLAEMAGEVARLLDTESEDADTYDGDEEPPLD